MCENGELPEIFLALNDKTVICPSCIIGNMKKRPWRYKGGYGSIRKAYPDFLELVSQLTSWYRKIQA